jgi:carboxyl-terminal processing protease
MRLRIRILLALLTAWLIFSLGAAIGFGIHWYLSRDNPTSEEARQFGIYWETWRIVADKFYGDIPAGPVPVYGAIKGALGTLNDPYTLFVEPQPRALEKADLEGKFGGIGALIRRGKAGEIILQPMVNSPAEKAGVKKDDVLVRVDDTAITAEMTTDQVVLLIRGEVGSQVTLILKRAEAAEPLTIVVTREVIETPSVEWRVLDQDHAIGYVHIRLFTERTGEETERAIQDLRAQGMTSLVVDLRDNGGGLLDAAVDVASQFLGSGVVLYEERRGQAERSYTVERGGVALDQPLALLVNGGTASASEIVAGALQDQQRARLIGEKTYGKGSVQLVYDLSDQSSVHVTVARWLTPNRHQIDNQGLAPDIEVAVSEEDRTAGKDPQLERAVAYLQEQARLSQQ